METEREAEFEQQAIKEFDLLYAEAQAIIEKVEINDATGCAKDMKPVARLGNIGIDMGRVFVRAPGVKSDLFEKRQEIMSHFARFIGC